MCPEGVKVETERGRCVLKVLKLSSEVSECKPLARGRAAVHAGHRRGPQRHGAVQQPLRRVPRAWAVRGRANGCSPRQHLMLTRVELKMTRHPCYITTCEHPTVALILGRVGRRRGVRGAGQSMAQGVLPAGRGADGGGGVAAGRGLHSSTFRLNVGTFWGIRWVHDYPPVYSTGGHGEV